MKQDAGRMLVRRSPTTPALREADANVRRRPNRALSGAPVLRELSAHRSRIRGSVTGEPDTYEDYQWGI